MKTRCVQILTLEVILRHEHAHAPEQESREMTATAEQ